MSWGIPGFRLDKDVMDGEISRVLTDSIEVKCGVNVGEDVTFLIQCTKFNAHFKHGII